MTPSPSCPDSSSPQHITMPAASRAQVWFHAVATDVAPATFITATGVYDDASVPFPRLSAVPTPQHRTVPSCRTAQVVPAKVPAPIAAMCVSAPALPPPPETPP